MQYWHMQLFPKERLSKTEEIARSKKILEHKVIGHWREESIEDFKIKMVKDDIVLIREGADIIGLVKVVGEYFEDNDVVWFRYRREVEVLSMKPEKYELGPYNGKTQGTLGKLDNPNTPTYKYIDKWYKKIMEEKKIQENKQALEYKKQIILQGPPGTGKTRMAKLIAKKLLEKEDVDDKELSKEDNFNIIQFHPSYSYEDFVRGIVADSEDGKITYETKDKILAKMAKQAKEKKEKAEKEKKEPKKYVLIIDEINRANLSSVLGELIYALEYRDEEVETMYEVEGNSKITLPDNLYIIGTMNTADRSIGHIDYAIRRRFIFIDVPPDESAIEDAKAKKLFDDVEKIFENHISPEFAVKDVTIGHSYFIVEKGGEERLELRLKHEIKPLLREYVKDGVLKKSAILKKDEKEKNEIEDLSI